MKLSGSKTIGTTFSEALNSYLENKFCLQVEGESAFFSDEPGIAFWKYFSAKIIYGDEVFFELKKCYPQLNFPIEKDVDKTELYCDYVSRGKFECIDLPFGLKLENRYGIKFDLYDSIAGKIPVFIIPNSNDFVTIMQSLLHKNNPVPIPQSMGAVMINGIVNRERLNSLKKDWLKKNPFGDWNKEFSEKILPEKEFYKDKLVFLSAKPYSNVPCEQLGLESSIWMSYAISIRREHECTHLYTLKKYGKACNNLHDELIADYVGIVKTMGSYRKKWMLKFMGLEEYPNYRTGARLENYIKESNLSDADFQQLITVVKKAIDTLDLFDQEIGELHSDTDLMCRIDSMCETSLLEMASPQGVTCLLQKYNEKHSQVLS